MLPPKRMTPATRRSRRASPTYWGGVVPREAEHDDLPDLLLERQLIDAATRDVARLKSQESREREYGRKGTHRPAQRRFAP